MTQNQILAAIALGIITNLITGLFLQPLAGKSLDKAGGAILSASSRIEKLVYRRIASRDVSLIVALRYAVLSIVTVVAGIATLVLGGLANSGRNAEDVVLTVVTVVILGRFVIELATLRFTNRAICITSN